MVSASQKNLYDIAVMHIGQQFDDFQIVGANEVAHDDMAIQQGNEVFILGYPLGFTFFLRTPIWKRGSIATEPHSEDGEARGRVVIDATTRGGMSGSPVIMRAKTHYVAEDGTIKQKVNASRWIGIYSSRPSLPASSTLGEEDRRAEIGYFLKSALVEQAMGGNVRGPRLGELP